jgi:TatD DNase family protein
MEDFEKDRHEVIEKSLLEGLKYILTVGTEEAYFGKVVDIIERYSSVYGAIGIHPHNSKDYGGPTEEAIRAIVKHKKIVGYGEIGLDFFKNYSPRELQVRAFQSQLELAQKVKLPAIIHSRNAKDETLRILKEAHDGSIGGVIHCYSYDLATAKKLLDMDFTISIPGTITYKNSHELVDVVKYVPVERLLAETDAPFLTPHPHRGKRNEPHLVKLTVEKIAQIKCGKIQDVARQITQNFERIFLRSELIPKTINDQGEVQR